MIYLFFLFCDSQSVVLSSSCSATTRELKNILKVRTTSYFFCGNLSFFLSINGARILGDAFEVKA